MPRELVAVAPKRPILQEYEEKPLGENEVRIKTEFSSPKHGTELHLYRGVPLSKIRHLVMNTEFYRSEKRQNPSFLAL